MTAAVAIERLPAPVFVLTSWNPRNQQLALKENRRRNRELRAILSGQDVTILNAKRRSRENGGCEESFAVVPLARKEARRLGRQFRQHAVFELSRCEQRVVGCFGQWEVCRRYDEHVEITRSRGRSLAEMLDAELGIEVATSSWRGNQRGWTLENELGLACPNCGRASLQLAGCDLISRAGAPYRTMMFVCVNEPRVMSPHEVPSMYRDVVKALRAFTSAAEDADARGLTAGKYQAYAIELDDEVGSRGSDLPWIYVGQSHYSPEERFAQHKSGIRPSRVVRKYGVHLRLDLTADQPFLRTAEEAHAYERWLFEWLKATGWPVKGGT